MNSEIQEKFQQEYQAGKNAFERGRYRLSVQHLQTATQMVARSSRLGGEIQIWLVSAYQAAGMLSEAIALCKELCTHPDNKIRAASKRLLYIIEAPRLNRPREWMSEIPDLTALSESDAKNVGSRRIAKNSSKPKIAEPVELDRDVDTRDNQFIWVALLAALAALGGVLWFATS